MQHWRLTSASLGVAVWLCTVCCVSAQEAPRPTALSAEIEFWQSVKDSKNPAEVRAYLDKHPSGEFATLARIRLQALETGARQEPPANAQAPKPTALPPPNPAVYKALADAFKPVEMTPEVVREVQQKLYDLNYRISKIDGVMSDETAVAIRRLQAALMPEPYRQAHGRPACRSQACQGSDGVGRAGLGQTAELGRVPATGPRCRRAGRQGPVQEEDGQGLPGHRGRDERLRCICRIGRPNRKYPSTVQPASVTAPISRKPASPRSLNAEGSRRHRICARSGRKSAPMVATSRSRRSPPRTHPSRPSPSQALPRLQPASPPPPLRSPRSSARARTPLPIRPRSGPQAPS